MNVRLSRMWRNRYNDLWLWPMPEWFVRACNRTIGVYVLDLMLVGVFVGLGLNIAGKFLLNSEWMRIIGNVLLAPVPLLIVMMICTAQYRQWNNRNDPPDDGTNVS